MKHQKIFKRESGQQIMIEVEFSMIGYFDRQIQYNTIIFHRGLGKYKWIHHPLKVDSEDNPLATKDEIMVVKLELWQKLKPK